MKLKLLFITLAAIIQAHTGFAAPILTNKIIGVGSETNRINPYVCIKNKSGTFETVKPGEAINLNPHKNNNGDVGAALRFGGCSESNFYLGWIRLNVSNNTIKVTSYTPFEDVHIAYQYKDQGVDSNGNLNGEIHYTEIKANDKLLEQAPRINPTWKFVGANLSGLEFGKMIDPTAIPNLSREDANSSRSDLKDTQAFLKQGMNTFRIPVSWGYLQLNGAGVGEIHQDYFNNYVKPLLETLTQAKVTAIVDLHSYMRYSVFGKEHSSGSEGTLILDEKAHQDIWLKLYKLIKNDSKINMDYIVFDLVNEPVDVPDDKVFTIQASVIKTLQQQGFKNYILVEGNAWSGLHSWDTHQWKSKDGKITYSNQTLFTRHHFEQAGITSANLDKILINVHQYLDSDFSGRSSQCQINFRANNRRKLDAFVDYLRENHFKAIVTEFGAGSDDDTCKNAMTEFMNYLQENAAGKNKDYGFVGWTVWSTGHAWGDGYPLRVIPGKMSVLARYLQ